MSPLRSCSFSLVSPGLSETVPETSSVNNFLHPAFLKWFEYLKKSSQSYINKILTRYNHLDAN